MKKVIITMVAFLAVSTSVMAAGHVDSVRYLTTKLGKNWFISANATANWWQGSMRLPSDAGYQNANPFYTKVSWGAPTFGFNINGGKWINHKTAVRLGYSNNKINSYIHGRHAGIQHIQFLYGDNPTPFDMPGNGDANEAIYQTSMRYHRLQADFMVSPVDVFTGFYNPNRIWTPVLYVGAGAAYTSGDFFALQTIIANKNPQNPLQGGNFELTYGAGLSNNFRISEHFDINLDLNWTAQRWSIDSWTYEFEDEAIGLRPKKFDNMYTASLGMIYYFSRVYELPVNCCEEMEEMRKRLQNIEEEMNAMPAVPDTVVKYVNVQTEDIVSYPFSIFFNRDSYKLMSGRDRVNLREIADVAIKNGYKLRLRGSCDSATASAAYNQTLSENRCRKIMMELMDMGVPESQFILVPVGGVKELNPTEYDRRVLIELVKEAPKD